MYVIASRSLASEPLGWGDVSVHNGDALRMDCEDVHVLKEAHQVVLRSNLQAVNRLRREVCDRDVDISWDGLLLDPSRDIAYQHLKRCPRDQTIVSVLVRDNVPQPRRILYTNIL